MGSLVAYFSYEVQNSVKKGNTMVVAEKIAAITGADIMRIEPKEKYPSDYDECCARAKTEINDNLRPAINSTTASARRIRSSSLTPNQVDAPPESPP